jgi:hypothetical protein
VADEKGKPPRQPRSKSTRRTEPPKRRGRGRGYEPPAEEKGEAVEAHAEFVARHYGGGAEATPERLDRAIEVWQRLPGAVVRGPAQLRPNRPAAAASDGEKNTSS